jgi:hypothetical protein
MAPEGAVASLTERGERRGNAVEINGSTIYVAQPDASSGWGPPKGRTECCLRRGPRCVRV